MTPRKRKPSAVKAECTRLHSRIVRSRGRCENCGDAWQANGSKLECAHIISRRFSRTRTLESNAFCLCSKCHMRFTEWPLEFAEFVVARIGEQAYADLRAVAYSTEKVDWFTELDRLKTVAEQMGVAA